MMSGVSRHPALFSGVPRRPILRPAFDLVARRRCAGRPNFCRTPRASSGEVVGTGTDVQIVELLRAALKQAVVDEDYAAAARLQKEISELEQKDPLKALEGELERAVAEERYGDAAMLRDQIKEMTPPPPEPPKLTSSKITEGVRVTVESFYVPARSRPEMSSYLFAYRIRIVNETHPTTVKLVSRRWTIVDAQGRQQEVRGRGVVGEEPELAPGEEFVYESSCQLRTKEGSMEGEYEFYSRVSPTDQWTTSFLVGIAKFGLSAEGPRLGPR